MNDNEWEIIIIGGGPAGLAAGIYAARGGAKVLLFAGAAVGGQIVLANEVENFPGFPQPVAGAELMQKMEAQAKRLGCLVLNSKVAGIKIDKSPFAISDLAGKQYYAKALIVATGARARWSGLPSEAKFRNKGVSTCATCDGFFFRGKDVCVIGGGDTAAEDALFLARFVNKVYLIHRRDKFRAAAPTMDKIRKNGKIEVIIDSVLDEILGSERIESIRIKNVRTGEFREIKLSGVFLAIGHDPETSLVKGKLELDDGGYIRTDSAQQTSVKGVFAAGDVTDPVYKQAVVAASSGAIAAIEAVKFINE